MQSCATTYVPRVEPHRVGATTAANRDFVLRGRHEGGTVLHAVEEPAGEVVGVVGLVEHLRDDAVVSRAEALVHGDVREARAHADLRRRTSRTGQVVQWAGVGGVERADGAMRCHARVSRRGEDVARTADVHTSAGLASGVIVAL